MKRDKRKLSIILLSITLLAAIMIGATLAYFTDDDEALNVITLGHVDIDLQEPNFPGGPEGGTIEDVMPGDEIPKDPTVSLDPASEDAYIRMTMETVITGLPDMYYEDDALYNEAIGQLLEGIDIQPGWYLADDGYYYYNRRLSGNDEATLFTRVEIPRQWGNAFAGCRIDITLTAEAIQADGFTPVMDVSGDYIINWLQDGEPITTETYQAR